MKMGIVLSIIMGENAKYVNLCTVNGLVTLTEP